MDYISISNGWVKVLEGKGLIKTASELKEVLDKVSSIWPQVTQPLTTRQPRAQRPQQYHRTPTDPNAPFAEPGEEYTEITPQGDVKKKWPGQAEIGVGAPPSPSKTKWQPPRSLQQIADEYIKYVHRNKLSVPMPDSDEVATISNNELKNRLSKLALSKILRKAAESMSGNQEVHTVPSIEKILERTSAAIGDAAKKTDPVMVSVTKTINIYEDATNFLRKFKSNLQDLMKKYDEDMAVSADKNSVQNKFLQEKVRLVRTVDSLIEKKFNELNSFLSK